MASERYKKELRKAKYYVEEIVETLGSKEKDDLALAYERICEIYKTMESAANDIKDEMLDSDKSVEEVRQWSQNCKQELKGMRDLRNELKRKLNEADREELLNKEEHLFNRKLQMQMDSTRKRMKTMRADLKRSNDKGIQ